MAALQTPRTAVTGRPHRSCDLPSEGGTSFAAADWGLVVSTLEDCAYVQTVSLPESSADNGLLRSVQPPKRHGLTETQTGKYGPVFGPQVEGESHEERLRRIDGMVSAMVAAYPSVLAPSFDPEERQRGVTALESERSRRL